MENNSNQFLLQFDENQQVIKDTIRDFAENKIKPRIMEFDEDQIFPKDLIQELGGLGFMGILIPEKFGGAGLGYVEYALIVEELARVDPSIALSVAAHNGLCSNHINLFANEDQKEKYLPDLATGKKIGAWALTEPGSGSDAAGMTTTAELSGDHYILNGTKSFITHGKSGEIAVVMAVTDKEKKSKGISAFIIEKGTEGFSAGKKENKLGMRASETTQLILENCKVPKENLLGKEGEGFPQAMKVLGGGRISIAALSVGLAQGCLEASVKYSKERKQFNKPISSFEAIQFKLADMATEIEAARLMTFKAAKLKDDGKDITKDAAIAKLYASEIATKTTNEAVQIFGGYGFVKDYPVEKFYRDVKLLTIGEGTSEVQRIVIARELLKDLSFLKMEPAMKKIGTNQADKPNFLQREDFHKNLVRKLKAEREKIFLGGGKSSMEKQRKKGKLTARERIEKLIDKNSIFYEMNTFAAYEMYEEYGGAPSAGTIFGLGKVEGRNVVIVANDATVKAGAWFPMTAKKIYAHRKLQWRTGFLLFIL